MMISVIMPAYNAERFIGQAIESVLRQSFTDWRLTIVNDGSVDGTKQVIEKYIRENGEKIRLIDKKVNEGTVSGLNTLIDNADGRYICWLSADDVYTKDMLKDSFEFLEQNKEYDLVFSDYEVIDESSAFLRSSPFKRYVEELKRGEGFQPYKTLLTERCCIHGCTVLAKRECFAKVGKFNPLYRYAHDYDLWLRMAAEFEIGYIDKVHVQGREYREQISMQGHNEVDAIRVLFDFIQNEDRFQKLYRKAGMKDRNKALYEVIAGQLKVYKHQKKEAEYLLERLQEDEDSLRDFRRDSEGRAIFQIIEALREHIWRQEESFFNEDSETNYLTVLCSLNEADAILINKQAVRFERMEGNTLERFNTGLMRNNDIVIGDVEAEKLYSWLENNRDGYYFKVLSEDKKVMKLAITFYLYAATDLTDELEIRNIFDTNRDIWWQLMQYMYVVPDERRGL